MEEGIMMQPLDVKNQKFKKGLFGYKAVDVDEFVSTVGRYCDELVTENAKLKEEKEKLDKLIEEKNLKIFELEKQANGDSKKDDKKASGSSNASKKDDKKNDKNDKKGKATTEFFEKANETTVVGGDDDEVFVGEIEEARKPSKAMIGDGEEEGGDDFEFL